MWAHTSYGPAVTSLSGRVALVTGASRGIGAGIARILASSGATVAINYLERDEAAEGVAREIRAAGGRATLVRGDVREEGVITEAVRRIEEQVGPISVLVHNAGASFQPKAIMDAVWPDFQRHFEVAVGGAFNVVRACLPAMRAQKRGVIVFVTSATAHAIPPPRWSCYVTAKSALLGFMRSLAVELGPLGIRVNAVSPAMVATDLMAFVPDRMKQMIAQQAPLQRLPNTSDVAAAVRFLVSDEADCISGVTFPIAGGSIMP